MLLPWAALIVKVEQRILPGVSWTIGMFGNLRLMPEGLAGNERKLQVLEAKEVEMRIGTMSYHAKGRDRDRASSLRPRRRPCA